MDVNSSNCERSALAALLNRGQALDGFDAEDCGISFVQH
jgi:hypothetical protein